MSLIFFILKPVRAIIELPGLLESKLLVLWWDRLLLNHLRHDFKFALLKVVEFFLA